MVTIALAFVIIAPAAEEITFRGFLYRGWAASRLGVFGAILLTVCYLVATTYPVRPDYHLPDLRCRSDVRMVPVAQRLYIARHNPAWIDESLGSS
jgi:hypothetical protein